MRSKSQAVLCALFAVVALTVAGCGGVSLPTENAPMEISNPADSYLIEPGNRVRVTVFNEPSLSGDFIVDPSGNLAMTLVGNIPASGVAPKALGQRVEAVLKKDGYLQSPKVAVEVQSFRPFYVLGEVRQPGEFPYTNGMTVLSAVAKAGGYDYRAWEGEVLLVRVVDGAQKEYRATERTPILPGDIVKVQQRRL